MEPTILWVIDPKLILKNDTAYHAPIGFPDTMEKNGPGRYLKSQTCRMYGGMTAAGMEVARDLVKHREIREIAFEHEEVYRIVTTNTISHPQSKCFIWDDHRFTRTREPVNYELPQYKNGQ